MKVAKGSTPRPRAAAEAGVRREAPNGGRSGGPRARRGARGDFQNPRTGDGDLAKNPRSKTRILYIFFHIQFITYILYTNLKVLAYLILTV